MTTSDEKTKLALQVRQRANAWLAGQDTREAKRLCFTMGAGAEPEGGTLLGGGGYFAHRFRTKLYRACRIADFWAWDVDIFAASIIRTIRCERDGETAWFVGLEAPTAGYSRGSPTWPREGEVGLIRNGDEIVVEVALRPRSEWAGLFLCREVEDRYLAAGAEMSVDEVCAAMARARGDQANELLIEIDGVPYRSTGCATLREALTHLGDVLRDHGAPVPEWLVNAVAAARGGGS